MGIKLIVEILETHGPVLAYRRSAEGDVRIAAVNFSSDVQALDLPGRVRVERGSPGGRLVSARETDRPPEEGSAPGGQPRTGGGWPPPARPSMPIGRFASATGM
jgi:hypothetical protein